MGRLKKAVKWSTVHDWLANVHSGPFWTAANLEIHQSATHSWAEPGQVWDICRFPKNRDTYADLNAREHVVYVTIDEVASYGTREANGATTYAQGSFITNAGSIVGVLFSLTGGEPVSLAEGQRWPTSTGAASATGVARSYIVRLRRATGSCLSWGSGSKSTPAPNRKSCRVRESTYS